MKGKSTHLVNVPDTSTNSTSSEPDYFNEHGDPVYAHMVNVKKTNWKKHLIQFTISVDFKKVRISVEKCPTVLLKLKWEQMWIWWIQTLFQTQFHHRTVLELTTLRMEAYGSNTEVTVQGKFHAFLWWKADVYRQLFYVTNANATPNLLSWDGCYTLGVLKPCYSVETRNSSKFQGNTQATPTQPTTHLEPLQMHDNSSLHLKNEGTSVEKYSHSTKWSVTKEQLWGVPLMKEDILEAYSDVFTRIGKFPSAPYKFQLKPNVKPRRHAPRWVYIHLQEAVNQEIWNLECLGILEPVKEVTEWVNNFVIMEKKVPVDSSNGHSPQHSVQKRLRICLDPRDLNEALEREPYYTQSIEEILGKFHGITWFIIADFNKWHWMVELHP